MLTGLLKGLLFAVVMAFYSLCVWRVVNDYFRNEFKSYIEQDPLLAQLQRASGASQPASIVNPAGQLLQPVSTRQPPPPHPQPMASNDIFGPGVDHRDAANFRTHLETIGRRLSEKHRQRVLVDGPDRLAPDSGEHIQQPLVDTSLNQARPDIEHKYAVMVFDGDLPGADNAVNVDESYDDDDNNIDYRDGNGIEDDEDGAFIAVVPQWANTNSQRPSSNDSNSSGSKHRTDEHEKIITALDAADSRRQPAAAAARKPSLIHANNNKLNQLLVTNDLSDGDVEGNADDDNESSGDNELIMPIDGNLIKSLGANRDSWAASGGVATAATRQMGANDVDGGSDSAALTEDCFCVRENAVVEEQEKEAH